MRLRYTFIRDTGVSEDLWISADAGATVADLARALAAHYRVGAGESFTLAAPSPSSHSAALSGPGRPGSGEEGGADSAAVVGRDTEAGSAAHESADGGPARDAASSFVALPPALPLAQAPLPLGSPLKLVAATGADNSHLAGGRQTNAGSGPIRRIAPVPFEDRALLQAAGWEGEGPQLELPSPPPPQLPNPFPWVAFILPLILALVLLVITQSAWSVLFVLVSPLLMAGVWLSHKVRTGQIRAAVKRRFAVDLGVARQRLQQVAGQQKSALEALFAPPGQMVPADAGLWAHPATSPLFGQVRLGRGSVPVAVQWKLPAGFTPWLAASPAADTQPDGQVVPAAAAGASAEEGELLRFYGQAQRMVAPVTCSLLGAGGFGVFGPAPARHDALRALLGQMLLRHSPADLGLCLVTDEANLSQWAAAAWSPQVAAASRWLGVPAVAGDPAESLQVLGAVEKLVLQRRSQAPAGAPAGGGQAALLVLLSGNLGEQARWAAVAASAASAGIFFITEGPQRSQSVLTCRDYLQIASDGQGASLQRHGLSEALEDFERLDPREFEKICRALAPWEDTRSELADVTDLPLAVGLGRLYPHAGQAAALALRWADPQRPGAGSPANLAAAIGLGSAGLVEADLARGGTLIVGGKSAERRETWQAWLAALALRYRPDEMQFLAWGGRQKGNLEHLGALPHCLGLATDLSAAGLRRDLAYLQAEVKRRTKAADEGQSTGPLLLLVISEVEAFKTSSEAMQAGLEILQLAAAHRHLGICLLATTGALSAAPEPSGLNSVSINSTAISSAASNGHSGGISGGAEALGPALEAALRQVCPLRLALQMPSVEMLRAALGTPLPHGTLGGYLARGGAHLGEEYAVEGRAWLARAGSGEEARLIQCLRLHPGVGAVAAGASGALIEIAPLSTPARTQGHRGGVSEVEDAPTNLQQVGQVCATAWAEWQELAGEAPEQNRQAGATRPWLEPLPAVVDLSQLRQVSDSALVLGLADDPARQSQYALYYRPEEDGSLGIFGAAGTGKSYALRALTLAGANTPQGGPAHFYLIDATQAASPAAGSAQRRTGAGTQTLPSGESSEPSLAGGLADLAALPNVGAVIAGGDLAAVAATLEFFAAQARRRLNDFAQVGARNLSEYRKMSTAEGQQCPRLFLLIDGLEEFLESGPAEFAGTILEILTSGRALGIHLVVCGRDPESLPVAWRGAFGLRLLGRGPFHSGRGGVGAGGRPGRVSFLDDSLLKDQRTVQLAIAGTDPQPLAQYAIIRNLAPKLGPQTAAPIAAEQKVEKASSLPLRGQDGRPALARNLRDGELLGFAPHGIYLLAGQSGSGRSNALRWWAESVRRCFPDTGLLHIAAEKSRLTGLDLWDGAVTGAAELDDFSGQLLEALQHESPADFPGLAIFIEDYPAFGHEAQLEGTLLEVLRRCREGGHLLVASGEGRDWMDSWPILSQVKSARAGLYLGSDRVQAKALFGVDLPENFSDKLTDLAFNAPGGGANGAKLAAGRGYLIEEGHIHRVQLPLAGQ